MTQSNHSLARSCSFCRRAVPAHVVVALIAAAMVFVAPRAANSSDLSTQSPFDSCGTVIVDELYYCYLFQADIDGKIYAVPGIDSYSYNPGDRLRVEGLAEFAVSFCTLHGQILDPTITPCDDETCLGDIDGDGNVDVFDLLALLSQWGPCGYNCAGDLDGNGVVDVFDLLTLLSAWGPCE